MELFILILKNVIRQLNRNRLRSVVVLVILVGSATAFVFVRGFTNDIIKNLEETLVFGETGHIQVASDGIWRDDWSKPRTSLFIDDPVSLIESLKSKSNVQTVAPRLSGFFLLNHNGNSYGVGVLGYNPEVEPQLKRSFIQEDGSEFRNDSLEMNVGADLAARLKLKTGAHATIIGQSLEGSMTSVEVTVGGLFRTGIEEVDKNFVYLPYRLVERLLGTKKAERISITLSDSALINQTIAEIKQTVGPNLIVKGWKERGGLYTDVVNFFNVQNLVIELVLAILIFFGLTNTLGISILERSAEVSLYRSLGDTKNEVLMMFVTEALIAALISILVFIPFSLGVISIFNSIEVKMQLPGSSIATNIHILAKAHDFISATVLLFSTTLVSILWPSWKMANESILTGITQK